MTTRVELTKTTKPGAYTNLGKALNFQAGDASNGNGFKATGRDLVVVRNADTVSHTFTVVSTDDKYGRAEDISESIGADEIKIYGPLQIHGWINPDGYIYCDVGDVNVEIAIVAL